MSGAPTPFSSASDQEIVDLRTKHGTAGVAEMFGASESAVRVRVCRIRKKGAIDVPSIKRTGFGGPIPEGMLLKGTSTLYDPDGNVKLEWVKTSVDKEEQERLFQEGLDAMKEDLPRLKPIAAPATTIEDLLNLYVITDYHFGMLAWHKEGGADWDAAIAEDILVKSFAAMMKGAPKADVGFICQLGDFLHSDGMVPVTPTAHNVLDQDGRFSKIVAAAIRLLRRIVDMALAKHNKVVVLMGEGNHDIASSIWLRQMFQALYEDDPRVQVDTSELPYYCYQHGKTMLAMHHGHLKKFASLRGTFAAQFPQIWGGTEYRYGHCGHVHHTESKEDMGMTVIQHPTLSAKDAYASRHGWFAERRAACTTYSAKFGQVASNYVRPEMLGG